MFPFVSDAMAQGAAGSVGQNPLFSFVPFVLIFVVFYFLLIRPQQKKQKALQNMISNLKKGDRVVTTGGMHGVIYKIGDSVITIEVADKVRIQMDRQQVSRVVEDNNSEGK